MTMYTTYIFFTDEKRFTIMTWCGGQWHVLGIGMWG